MGWSAAAPAAVLYIYTGLVRSFPSWRRPQVNLQTSPISCSAGEGEGLAGPKLLRKKLPAIGQCMDLFPMKAIASIPAIWRNIG